jgi:hypothetical protein
MIFYRLPFGHEDVRIDRRDPRPVPALQIALRARKRQ